MVHCKVTLAVNAGVVLEFGRTCIWSDVLHDEKAPRFSTVTPELAEKLLHGGVVAAPDMLLYSHCHRDHYSRGLTARALERWPQVQLVMPRQDFDRQILISGESQTLTFQGLQFRFGRLTHQGEQFADIINYGCIINAGGFRVLLAGDATFETDELEEFVAGEHIDLAIMGFPWVSRPNGREIMDQIICPDHLLVYHLPFREDNWAGLRESAAAGARFICNIPDLRFLQEPFQTEIY